MIVKFRNKVSGTWALFLTVLLLSNCYVSKVYAQEKIKRYRFELIDNKIILKAYINGHGPYNFQYDSGASGIGRLDISLVNALKLPDSGTTQNFDGHNRKIEKKAYVKCFKIGGVEKHNITVMYRDYNQGEPAVKISGLVGSDFFESFMVAIDYPERMIEISNGRLHSYQSGVMSYDAPFSVINKIGGITTSFDFDSGSSQRFHFPEGVIKQLSHSPTGLKSTAKRANTVFELTETIIRDTIWLGNKPFVNQKVNYSSQASWVNIGTGFLKDYKITFDHKNKLIRIE